MLKKFQYPVLTKAQTLNFSSLKTIKDKIKANASSIHSELGGGMHGHLGAVTTPAEYAHVSPTPYVEPVNPPPLVVPFCLPFYTFPSYTITSTSPSSMSSYIALKNGYAVLSNTKN